MTRSVYVIGGAATGKSTFMASLLDGVEFGPLSDLYSARPSRSLITLRGHWLEKDDHSWGLYLGVMREQFPGTDGLDRVSHTVASSWLSEESVLPDRIVGEGLNLSNEGFLKSLAQRTDLLLVYLTATEETVAARCALRGSEQKPIFLKGSASRARNAATAARSNGIRVIEVSAEDHSELDLAQDLCAMHLQNTEAALF